MSREKQIEEMAKLLNRCAAVCEDGCSCSEKEHAEVLYNAGYRKQSEGEWKPQFEGSTLFVCTACGYEYCDRLECINFCGNCGAKMKGGAE